MAWVQGIKIQKGGKKLVGTAVPADVRSGKTFVGTTGKLQTGTYTVDSDRVYLYKDGTFNTSLFGDVTGSYVTKESNRIKITLQGGWGAKCGSTKAFSISGYNKVGFEVSANAAYFYFGLSGSNSEFQQGKQLQLNSGFRINNSGGSYLSKSIVLIDLTVAGMASGNYYFFCNGYNSTTVYIYKIWLE